MTKFKIFTTKMKKMKCKIVNFSNSKGLTDKVLWKEKMKRAGNFSKNQKKKSAIERYKFSKILSSLLTSYPRGNVGSKQ